VLEGCLEVGPPLFGSLVVAALSFLPVLAFQSEAGRLFAPLAYTKTYAMLAAAILSITVLPVLACLLIRGRICAEAENPVRRFFVAGYQPLLAGVLRRPWHVLWGAVALVVCTAWPASQLGTEFMPDMDEGDLLYMPTMAPGLAVEPARALLQQMDRALRQVPE